MFNSHLPVLETDRLILRQLRGSDRNDMFSYASQNQVTQYLLWDPHESLQNTDCFLRYATNGYKTGSFHDWAVIFKENKHMIGTCGFAHLDKENHVGEIGYVLNPEYWGQGLALEAAQATIAYGFDRLFLNRIEARYMVENKNSLCVMKKLGMTFEGVLRAKLFVKGSYRDIGFCSILREEYEQRKNSLKTY